MKKIILTLTALCSFVLFTKAQLITGQKTFGGSVNFNHFEQSDTSSFNPDNRINNMGVSFTLGKFVTNTHEEGIQLSYSLNNQKLVYKTNINPSYNNNSNTISVGYYSKYYKPIGMNFYFTVNWVSNGSYTFGNSSATYVSPPSTYTSKLSGWGLNTGLTPGIAYKLNKKWLMNLGLANVLNIYYNHSENKGSQNDIKNDNFGIISSLNNSSLGGIAIGFNYLF